jgi:hypothetical protein
MKSSYLALVLSSALFAPLTAHAQDNGPAAAKSHFDKGMILYNIQDWPASIRELKAAYAAEPKPEYLYTIAQAQRLSGDCAAAILSYRSFERLSTGGSGATAAEGFIHKCEEQIKQEDLAKAAAATPTPVVVRPAASPPPAPVTPANGTWYKDPIGDALLVLGVGGAVAGTVFFVQAGSAKSAATSGNEGAYASNSSTAKRDSIIGSVGVGAGGVLLAGAIWRYLVVGARGKEEASAPPPAVGFSVEHQGLQLSCAGTF